MRRRRLKETAKEAWDSIRVMRVGVDRVRKSKAQSLYADDAIEVRARESAEDFATPTTRSPRRSLAPDEESKVVRNS